MYYYVNYKEQKVEDELDVLDNFDDDNERSIYEFIFIFITAVIAVSIIIAISFLKVSDSIINPDYNPVEEKIDYEQILLEAEREAKNKLSNHYGVCKMIVADVNSLNNDHKKYCQFVINYMEK